VTLYFVSRAIRWLLESHLHEAVAHLLEKYDRRYRFRGIPRGPLMLIAKCAVWVFALKLTTELAEPFVVFFFFPEMSDRVFGVARYDWLVLSALMLLVGLFWLRFHRHVRVHDGTKPDSQIDRNWWRTIPLFGQPAFYLLLLMFLPDLCRFGANIAADWMKTTVLAFSSAQASGIGPLWARTFARGLWVSLVPSKDEEPEKPR
jgi:hypothetical protein